MDASRFGNQSNKFTPHQPVRISAGFRLSLADGKQNREFAGDRDKNSVDTENPVLILQSDAGRHFFAGISQSLAGGLKTDDRRVNTRDSP